MFGWGVPEFSVLLVLLLTVYIIKKSALVKPSGNERECLACHFKGKMKTWLGNYGFPQFLAIVLLFCYFIPGLIFIAWGWGKYKCPRCGAVGKNVPLSVTDHAVDSSLKTCPFCAEKIQSQAIKCRFCGSDLQNGKIPTLT